MGLIASLLNKITYRREHRLLRSGNESEIIELTQTLVSSGEEERALYLVKQAAERFAGSGAVEQARESIENAVTWKSINATLRLLDHDGSPEIRARLAEMYWRVGDTASALRCGREALQLDPENSSGYRVIGKIYLDQFRLTKGTIEGMNAVRCLFKAHQLHPDDSGYLLKLAEVFILLEAPIAASKFLLPVKRAFANDLQVQHLAEQIEKLPPEETTQIPDLFARLEARRGGDQPQQQAEVPEIPREMQGELDVLVSNLPQDDHCFVVGSNREILWGRALSPEQQKELGSSFGVLTHSAQQLCQRMGIGEFNQLHINTNDFNAVLSSITPQISGLHMSADKRPLQDCEKVVERVREKVLTGIGGGQ